MPATDTSEAFPFLRPLTAHVRPRRVRMGSTALRVPRPRAMRSTAYHWSMLPHRTFVKGVLFSVTILVLGSTAALRPRAQEAQQDLPQVIAGAMALYPP